MAVVRIALERLLHQQRQPVEALAHIGVAGRQPNLYPARNRDHRCPPLLAITASAAASSAESTAPGTPIRDPFANSISIVRATRETIEAGSVAISAFLAGVVPIAAGDTATGTNCGSLPPAPCRPSAGPRRPWRTSCRHLCSSSGWISHRPAHPLAI